MPNWVKYMLALVIPAFLFLILKDTAGGYYFGSQSRELSYVVAEPVEEPEPIVEVARTALDADAVVEETDVEETGVAEPAEAETSEQAPLATEVAEASADSVPAVEEEIIEAPATDLVAALSPVEMEAAARAARACSSCHQFARERNGAGPHLVGVGGRTIGSVDGFRYSDALMALNADGAVWTADELAKWLAGPSVYAPGTKMNFVVRNPDEQRLIAQWLVQKDQ